ncbi:JAB domain-containing protein, partial [uncultured Dubosiella sp.]
DDRKTTTRLLEVADTMGIQIMDHIIVGKDRYYSFKQHDALR